VGGERDEASDVRPSCIFVTRLCDPPPRDDEGERADRDIDEEDPAPAEGIREDAADERPGRDGRADGGSPGRERASGPRHSCPISARAVAKSAAPPIP
jgi:hypothetical protein